MICVIKRPATNHKQCQPRRTRHFIRYKQSQCYNNTKNYGKNVETDSAYDTDTDGPKQEQQVYGIAAVITDINTRDLLKSLE